jgi:hypothetical protein
MKEKDIKNKKDRYKNLDLALIVIPFFILYIFFFVIKDTFDYNLKKQDLIRVEGVIVWSELFHKTGNKASYEKSGIYFKLKGKEDIYSIVYQGKEAFKISEKYFKIHDSIVLYHRHRWQQLISWGDLHKIYYLESNKNVLRDYFNRPKHYTYYMNLIIGSVLFIVWLGFLIFYYVKYKPQHNNPHTLFL